jgi:hypothetical protein
VKKPRADAPPPIPNGLTKAQGAKFLKLLATEDYEAWKLLRDKRTNADEVDIEAAQAQMLLWAARQGHKECLPALHWTPRFTTDELLYLLEVGVSKSGDSDTPLDYIPWYGELALERSEAIAKIEAAHAQAGDWGPELRLGFRLLRWLTSDITVEPVEARALQLALAREHVWNPYDALSRWDRRLGKRLSSVITPKSVALAIGDKKGWVDALMQVSDEKPSGYFGSGRFARFVDIFETMSTPDIERFLPDFDAGALPDDLRCLDAFFRARNLSESESLRIAAGLAKARENHPRALRSRLADVLALQVLEKNPDADVDADLSFSIADEVWAERYEGALRAMSPAHRRTLVERDLEDPEATGGGLLGAAVDPALHGLLARYSEKGTIAFVFVRQAAKHLSLAQRAGFYMSPPHKMDALLGFSPRQISDLVGEIQDPRASAADQAFFGREVVTVLVRWSPRHPAAMRALDRLTQHKPLGYLSRLLEVHEAPIQLLEQLSILIDDPSAERGARELFSTADYHRLDITKAQLSPLWAGFRAAYLESRKAPDETPTTQFEAALRRARELAVAVPGETSRIYALQIKPDRTTHHGTTYLRGAFAGGALSDQEELFLTVDCASVPELAARYPDCACVSIIAPSAVAQARDAWSETRVVKVKKNDYHPAKPVEGHAIELHPIDVPVSVFNSSDRGDTGVLADLYDALWSLPGYLLGEGLWGGAYNNAQPDMESEGVNAKFVVAIKTHWLGEDGALFVYEDLALFER